MTHLGIILLFGNRSGFYRVRRWARTQDEDGVNLRWPGNPEKHAAKKPVRYTPESELALATEDFLQGANEYGSSAGLDD